MMNAGSVKLNFKLYLLNLSCLGTPLLVLLLLLISLHEERSSCLASSSSFRTAAGFGQEVEPDSFSGLGSYVRCSKSKLSMDKSMALYTWEVDGFLDYLKYLRDFGNHEEYSHKTGNISFESEKINGDWSFEIRSNGENNLIRATYRFTETLDNGNGNFGIKLRILQPHFENIDLPIQKPTSTTREKIHYGAAVKEKEKVSSSYLFLYSQSSEEQEESIVEHKVLNTVTLKFNWPSINTDKFLEFQNPNSELTFAFLIHGFFPKDTKTMKKSTCSLEGLENKYVQAGLDTRTSHRSEQLPASTMKAAFQSSSFSDYVIRVEDLDIPVHGVILYYSSPVFAAAVDNAAHEKEEDDDDGSRLNSTTTTQFHSTAAVTKNNNNSRSVVCGGGAKPIIFIDDEIGYNATLEMLRYVYTRRVKHLAEFADRIIIGAERYQLLELKVICENYLISKVNLTNVIENYVLAIAVNSRRLIRKAFAVIQMNRAQLVQMSTDFQKLSTKYPNLMFELFVS